LAFFRPSIAPSRREPLTRTHDEHLSRLIHASRSRALALESLLALLSACSSHLHDTLRGAYTLFTTEQTSRAARRYKGTMMRRSTSTCTEPRPEGKKATIRDHAQAEASLQEVRGWIDDGQDAIRTTADVVEHARRFLVACQIVPGADAGSAAAADATNSRLDLQVHAFGDSVDCLVARVHDAIAEAARDYETVNQLHRALRRVETGQENVR
jgi:hypothetical protein